MNAFLDDLYSTLTTRIISKEVFVREGPPVDSKPIEAGEASYLQEASETREEPVPSPPPSPPVAESKESEFKMDDFSDTGVFDKNMNVIHHGVNHVVSEDVSEAQFVNIETKSAQIKPLNMSAREIREMRAMGLSVAQSVSSLRSQSSSKSIQRDDSKYSFEQAPVPDEDPRVAIRSVVADVIEAAGDESVETIMDVLDLAAGREEAHGGEKTLANILTGLTNAITQLVDPRIVPCAADYAKILSSASLSFARFDASYLVLLTPDQSLKVSGDALAAVDAFAARVAFCDFVLSSNMAKSMLETPKKVRLAIEALVAFAPSSLQRYLHKASQAGTIFIAADVCQMSLAACYSRTR